MFVALGSEAQESVTGCSATAPGASGARWRPPLARRLGRLRSRCGVALGGTLHRYLLSSYGSSCGLGHVGRMGLKAAPLPAGAHCSPATITPCSTPRHPHLAWATSTQRGPPATSTHHEHPVWVTSTQHGPPAPSMGHLRPNPVMGGPTQGAHVALEEQTGSPRVPMAVAPILLRGGGGCRGPMAGKGVPPMPGSGVGGGGAALAGGRRREVPKAEATPEGFRRQRGWDRVDAQAGGAVR